MTPTTHNNGRGASGNKVNGGGATIAHMTSTQQYKVGTTSGVLPGDVALGAQDLRWKCYGPDYYWLYGVFNIHEIDL